MAVIANAVNRSFAKPIFWIDEGCLHFVIARHEANFLIDEMEFEFLSP